MSYRDIPSEILYHHISPHLDFRTYYAISGDIDMKTNHSSTDKMLVALEFDDENLMKIAINTRLSMYLNQPILYDIFDIARNMRMFNMIDLMISSNIWSQVGYGWGLLYDVHFVLQLYHRPESRDFIRSYMIRSYNRPHKDDPGKNLRLCIRKARYAFDDRGSIADSLILYDLSIAICLCIVLDNDIPTNILHMRKEIIRSMMTNPTPMNIRCLERVRILDDECDYAGDLNRRLHHINLYR